MKTELIESAATKLEFRDIVLHESSLGRSDEFEPLLYPFSVTQKRHLNVKVDELSLFDSDDEEIPILRAYIEFQLFGYHESEPKSPLFSIEATFRVDYLLKGTLTKKELDAFTKYNAVHNVWPFWRQHVFYIVNNAKLPRITIPLFRRPPGTSRPSRTTRKAPVR